MKGLMFYLSQSTLLINLLLMTTIWLSTAFSQFLLRNLASTVEQVFLSAVFASVSELVACATAGIVFQFAGIRISLAIAFAIAFIGSVSIVGYGMDH